MRSSAPAPLERVHRTPEDDPLRVAGGEFRAVLPRRQPVAEQVRERQRHRDEHVGVGVLEDHVLDVGGRPVLEVLLRRELGLGVRGQHLVEGVEVLPEHLPGPVVDVLLGEVERMGDPVEDERVTDHRWTSSLCGRCAAT